MCNFLCLCMFQLPKLNLSELLLSLERLNKLLFINDQRRHLWVDDPIWKNESKQKGREKQKPSKTTASQKLFFNFRTKLSQSYKGWAKSVGWQLVYVHNCRCSLHILIRPLGYEKLHSLSRKLGTESPISASVEFWHLHYTFWGYWGQQLHQNFLLFTESAHLVKGWLG